MGSQRVFLFGVVAVAALGGFLFGYDTAVISGAMLFLRGSFALTTPLQQGVTVSIELLGAALGAVVGGRLSDLLGRRRTLICLASLFVVGEMSTAFADSWSLFIALRFLVGLCVGGIASVVPVYISEVAPSHLRGVLVTCNQLAITIGIALAYWVDLAFTDLHMGWAPMYAVIGFPGLMLLFGMMYNTETPRWYANHQRWLEARKALERLHETPEQAAQELEMIRRALNSQQRSSWRELFRPGLRTALLVSVGLAIFQQFVGINTVIYYAPIIFEHAGFVSASSALFAAGIVGIVNVLTTIVAAVLVDRVGRRPLLLWGTACMVVSLFILGLISQQGDTSVGYLTLLLLLCYIIAFALSMGPIFWLLIAEIFPTRLRAIGASIGTSANWVANLLVCMSFLSLINTLGKTYTFWLYAVMGIGAFLFCYWLVPETKGRSLEQIEQYWQQKGLSQQTGKGKRMEIGAHANLMSRRKQS
jgi:sugar porter (SP) family MFS transporter